MCRRSFPRPPPGGVYPRAGLRPDPGANPPPASQGEIEGPVPIRPILVLYGAAMIALIVGLDVTVFRREFWPRLLANVGIVLVFAAFYMRFLRRP